MWSNRNIQAGSVIGLAFGMFAFLQSWPAAAIVIASVIGLWVMDYLEQLDQGRTRPTKTHAELQQQLEKIMADHEDMKSKLSSLTIASAAKSPFRR
jgi:hypothetical protein